ncbi:MAG: response regulator transcription factor [Bacillota bacterium]
MAGGARILVVDDEPYIRELVRLYLMREGYDVLEATDGDMALEQALTGGVDLVILDIMLPGRDGWEVCRQLRAQSDVPVIILSARGEEIDRILGLEMGADDYLTKPFSPRELVSRVKAVLRRTLRPQNTQDDLVFANFSLNLPARELVVKGRAVPCPAREFDLLAFLAARPGRVFTREQLLEQVWGYEYFGDARTVDVHVRRLREKIEPIPEEPRYLVTVWGVGYKFQEAP